MVCYDFFLFRLSQPELLRIHGYNGPFTRENLLFGIRLVYEIVEEVAGL